MFEFDDSPIIIINLLLQVVSSDASESEVLSSLATSDSDSCRDPASSPRAAVLPDKTQEAAEHINSRSLQPSGDGAVESSFRNVRTSQSVGARNDQKYRQSNEYNRNSSASTESYAASDASNGSSSLNLPSSTTCPELYNTESNRSEDHKFSCNKAIRNRSDQDLLNQEANSGPREHDGLQACLFQSTGETTKSLSGEGVDGDLSKAGKVCPRDDNSVNADGTGEDPNKIKAYRIAWELVSTEETYVRVLHLIDQVIFIVRSSIKIITSALLTRRLVQYLLIINHFVHCSRSQ